MASRNFHKNRTKERKARQAHALRVERLRHRVMQLAGMYPERVVRMSIGELEQRVKNGGRMRMISPMDGIALAMASAQHAPKMFVRDGKRMPFGNL